MANFVLGPASTPPEVQITAASAHDPIRPPFSSASSTASGLHDAEDGFQEDELTLTSPPMPSHISSASSSQPSSLPPMQDLYRSNSFRTVRNNSNAAAGKKRHYKKDSRYLLDLYTLTFDEHETVDEIETCKTLAVATAGDPMVTGDCFYSLAPSTYSNGGDSGSGGAGGGGGSGAGPMSLGSNQSLSRPGQVVPSAMIPALETNLHKILARKIQDSEEVSFRKAKLLTKAYYMLLRESATPIVEPQAHTTAQRTSSKPIGHGRLSWQTLLRTDPAELRRIVTGLGNTVAALNDYLMDLLVERDELLGQQDNMLEEISELTDNLL